MSTLTIRPMSAENVGQALVWARDEGWNPGLDDAVAFRAADPSGFLMGWLGTLPVACLSVVKYDERYAFLGLFIVRPAFRGKGYGKAIWDAGLLSAAGRTIGLDGVPAQQPNYVKSGFALAHRSARWSGRLRGLVTTRSFVRPLGPEDVGAVLDYDSRHVAAPRERFLRSWLMPSASRLSEGFFEDGQLRGYGSIRRAANGWKIGPLFADSPAIAETLLATLVTPAGTDEVFIDIPEPNAAALAIAQRLGFSPSFETARMYLGPPPDLPLERVFGISTLELG